LPLILPVPVVVRVRAPPLRVVAVVMTPIIEVIPPRVEVLATPWELKVTFPVSVAGKGSGEAVRLFTKLRV
jgi:hypothetical protein